MSRRRKSAPQQAEGDPSHRTAVDTHQNVDALLKALRLSAAVGTAHDDAVGQRVVGAQVTHDAVHLQRQLAHGQDDDGASAVAGLELSLHVERGHQGWEE